MTRAPTTLREHFRADPRGASSYTQWIEDRVWELLQRPARLQYREHSAWFDLYELAQPAHRWLLSGHVDRHGSVPIRVVLLGGTVIKEWPAKET